LDLERTFIVSDKRSLESAPSIFTRNSIVSGLKFLFRVTLRRLDLVAECYYVRQPITIPPVLSADEVEQLLTAAKSLRVRVMLSLAYGCGLRAGEVIRLRAGDIDSAQNIIRIVQGKGRKDRHVMLPPCILDLAREWWPERPTDQDARMAPWDRWLFPGRVPGKPLTTRQLNRLFHEAARAAGIAKRVSLHTSRQRRAFSATRHSFATHLLEHGTDIRLIPKRCLDITGLRRPRITPTSRPASSPRWRARSTSLPARWISRRKPNPASLGGRRRRDRRRRRWLVPGWKSRISSASTAPPGAVPMPAMSASTS
jgi:site-specific recombinase XerD